MESDPPKRRRDTAHVKMLLNAAMTAACEEHNPPLEKAFANLTAFQDHIETTIHRVGWQPEVLQAVLNNLSLDHLGDELDEFSEHNMRLLKQTVRDSLNKDIDQQVVYRALEEFVEEQRKEIEAVHGVALDG